MIRQKKNHRGKLTENGVVLETHEKVTINYFLRQGKDIELLPPSNTPKNKMSDIYMDGLAWEMKSPEVADKKAIERIFHRAAKKSQNIIMDLRRLASDTEGRKMLEKCFNTSGKVRKMLVITKDGTLVKFKKCRINKHIAIIHYATIRKF